jgi:hypothetical protein
LSSGEFCQILRNSVHSFPAIALRDPALGPTNGILAGFPLGSLQKRARRVLLCQDPQSELLKYRLIYHEARGIRRFAGFLRGAAAPYQAIRYTLSA